jgi:hypothetical protein
LYNMSIMLIRPYEQLSGDMSALRASVESQFTTDAAVVADRLAEQQERAAAQGVQVWFGHETECIVEYPDPRDGEPDRDAFYEQVIRQLCGGRLPAEVGKGVIVNPRANSAPVLLNTYYDTYNPDQPGSSIIEVRTAPAEYAVAEERYWRTLETIGGLADKLGLVALAAATHMSTSYTCKDENGHMWRSNNYENGGTLLVPAQRARRLLQPLLAYSAYFADSETLATKAARWNIDQERDEGRYPGFPVVDTRPDMLGALCGANDEIEGYLPASEYEKWRQCSLVQFFCSFPELEGLNDLVFWERGVMFMPESMTRGNIAAAGLKLSTLDKLVAKLTGGNITDFATNNAAVLREAVASLRVNENGDVEAQRSKYKKVWDKYLDYNHTVLAPVARIAARSPYGVWSQSTWRKHATRSPQVKRLLGNHVHAALTPPDKAAELRTKALSAHMAAAA